jgi:hypothetical protein
MHCLPVLIYIQDLTCHRTASRVSCLPHYTSHIPPLLPAWEAVQSTSPLLHSTWQTSRYSLRAHCISSDTTLKLMQGDNYHARMKHINIHYHFIQDVVNKGYIKLQYCPTDDMMVDILTKALPHWKVNQHVLGLRLHRPYGGVLESGGSGACADEAESR